MMLLVRQVINLGRIKWLTNLCNPLENIWLMQYVLLRVYFVLRKAVVSTYLSFHREIDICVAVYDLVDDVCIWLCQIIFRRHHVY